MTQQTWARSFCREAAMCFDASQSKPFERSENMACFKPSDAGEAILCQAVPLSLPLGGTVGHGINNEQHQHRHPPPASS